MCMCKVKHLPGQTGITHTYRPPTHYYFRQHFFSLFFLFFNRNYYLVTYLLTSFLPSFLTFYGSIFI